MTDIEWVTRPDLWPLTVAAPLLWTVLWIQDTLRAHRVRQEIGPRLDQVTRHRPGRRRRRRRTLLFIATGMAVFAALAPRWGEPVPQTEPGGADVLVALDVSLSMQAADVSPTRLEVGKEVVRRLADRVEVDRIGLVGFAGDARLFVPLTRDRAPLLDALDELRPASTERGGTDLGAALRGGMEALPDDSNRHRCIVLVTDGEDLVGDGRAIARLCETRDVVVHTVGVGSLRGSKIAVASDRGTTFLRDAMGSEVVTAIDLDRLEAISSQTGGALIHVRGPEALVRLYEDEIVPAARTLVDPNAPKRRPERFQWPLFLAFLLWTLELWTADRSRA